MKALVPALVMLVAGFGGGYLFGSADSGADAPTDLSGGDTEYYTPITSPDLATADGVESGPGLATTTEALAPLREALTHLPDVAVPRGKGVITGTVKTDAGAPVEGVKVKLTPRYPPDEKPGAHKEWETAPLEVIVQKTVARWRWTRATRQETLTRADGSYRFEGVTSAKHSIQCEHDDYSFQASDHMAAWQAKAGAKIDFRAQAAVSIHVDILMPDGTAPEVAQVSFVSGGSTRGAGWSSHVKTVKQKPGSYEVKVTGGYAQEYKAEPQSVVLELGKTLSLTFQLTTRPALRGNIVYPDGEAFQGTQVYASRLRDGERPDAARLKSGGKSVWVHRHHRRSGFDFSFPDLVPGRYVLGAMRTQNTSVVVMQVVQVGDGLTEQDLVIPPLGRDEYALVHVLGPDGKPHQDVQVTTGYRHKGSRSSGGSNMLKRADGSLWVLHHQGGTRKDDGGEYYVKVTSTLLGSLEEPYRLGPDVELTLRFQEPASIEVNVSGVLGTRYEGRVSVNIQRNDGRSRRYFGTRADGNLDAKGRMTQTGVQPGTYTLVVGVKDDRRSTTVHTQTLIVTPGRNTVSVKLPELASVTILGAEGSVSLSTKTSKADGSTMVRGMRSTRADKTGRVVFDGLPPGTYKVRSGRKKAEFTLPGPSEVELR